MSVLYDKDIREPLFDHLEQAYGKVRILEEIQTGKARADAVMVTEDRLYGIEIKSDADTYTRLEGQVRNYDRYYDRNYIVAGTSHAYHVEEHVPEWWGIITVEPDETGKPDFYELRRPGDNPHVKPELKLSFLWRPELNHILKKARLPAYKEKSKRYVQRVLLDRVRPALLWPLVCEELLQRDYTTIEEEIKEYRRSCS